MTVFYNEENNYLEYSEDIDYEPYNTVKVEDSETYTLTDVENIENTSNHSNFLVYKESEYCRNHSKTYQAIIKTPVDEYIADFLLSNIEYNISFDIYYEEDYIKVGEEELKIVLGVEENALRKYIKTEVERIKKGEIPFVQWKDSIIEHGSRWYAEDLFGFSFDSNAFYISEDLKKEIYSFILTTIIKQVRYPQKAVLNIYKKTGKLLETLPLNAKAASKLKNLQDDLIYSIVFQKQYMLTIVPDRDRIYLSPDLLKYIERANMRVDIKPFFSKINLLKHI